MDAVPDTERSTISSSPRNGEVAPVKLRRYATRDFLERLTMIDRRRTMSTDSGLRLMSTQHRRFQIRDLQPDDDANQILGDNGTIPESEVAFERARAMSTGGVQRRRGIHDMETISSVSSRSNVTDRARNRLDVQPAERNRGHTVPEVEMESTRIRLSDHSEQSMICDDDPNTQLPEAQLQSELC